MKKLILLLAAVLITAISTMAQVAINTDDTDANASAILDVKSTTMGLLPPRMLQAQMDAIANPATGLMVYCTDCAPASVRVYSGLFWGETNGYPADLADDEIFSPATGRIWKDRNLGASQVATSSTDPLAYGDLYQWGRLADGHQVRTSGTTTNLSYSNTPPSPYYFILNNLEGLSEDGDWRVPKNDNLWQNGLNEPCPAGYRVPTISELTAESSSWPSGNYEDAGFPVLKLPLSGERSFYDGSLEYVGTRGQYWSSSVGYESTDAKLLYFRTSGFLGESNMFRAQGYSIRCIKD